MTMKKEFYLLLWAMVLLMAGSCSSDDELDYYPSAPISEFTFEGLVDIHYYKADGTAMVDCNDSLTWPIAWKESLPQVSIPFFLADAEMKGGGVLVYGKGKSRLYMADEKPVFQPSVWGNGKETFTTRVRVGSRWDEMKATYRYRVNGTGIWFPEVLSLFYNDKLILTKDFRHVVISVSEDTETPVVRIISQQKK